MLLQRPTMDVCSHSFTGVCTARMYMPVAKSNSQKQLCTKSSPCTHPHSHKLCMHESISFGAVYVRWVQRIAGHLCPLCAEDSRTPMSAGCRGQQDTYARWVQRIAGHLCPLGAEDSRTPMSAGCRGQQDTYVRWVQMIAGHLCPLGAEDNRTPMSAGCRG